MNAKNVHHSAEESDMSRCSARRGLSLRCALAAGEDACCLVGVIANSPISNHALSWAVGPLDERTLGVALHTRKISGRFGMFQRQRSSKYILDHLARRFHLAGEVQAAPSKCSASKLLIVQLPLPRAEVPIHVQVARRGIFAPALAIEVVSDTGPGLARVRGRSA